MITALTLTVNRVLFLFATGKKVSAIMQVNITVTFVFVTVLKVLFEVKMQLGF